MRMHTDEQVNQSIAKDKERKLEEMLKELLVSGNPNPERKGCPDQKLIREIAFHKPLGDPQLFEQITAHMTECSECVRDALRYVNEYRQRKKKSR